MPARKQLLEVAGREVTISNPDKLYFPRTGHTKLDLVRYYLAVADGAVRGVAGRPMALKRFVNGAEGEFFFQKRAPTSRPDWIETIELSFPSGRTAHEIVVRDPAQLAWVVNLGCIDLNPHPVRADELDHPDELRVDLLTKDVLEAFDLIGWPKTSGSRGFHVYCRIERRWTFPEVRRAAVALAREVERQAPDLATSKGWMASRDHSSPSSIWPRSTRPQGSRTLPGPPNSPSSRPSRHGSNPPSDDEPGLLRGRGSYPLRLPARRAVQRAGAGRRCRSSRSPGRPRKPRRGKDWSAGKSATRRCGRTWTRPTCWWIRCGDGAPPGPGSGSTCGTCPRSAARPRRLWRSTTTRGRATRDHPAPVDFPLTGARPCHYLVLHGSWSGQVVDTDATGHARVLRSGAASLGRALWLRSRQGPGGGGRRPGHERGHDLSAAHPSPPGWPGHDELGGVAERPAPTLLPTDAQGRKSPHRVRRRVAAIPGCSEPLHRRRAPVIMTRHPAVDEYLGRLQRSMRNLPAGRRSEIVEEIEEHIEEMLAEMEATASDADIRNALERLGDPDDIAAEARERFGIRPANPSWTDTAAVILLPIGGLVLPVIGWIVGVVLLWISDVWSIRDKLIGTLVVPGGLLLPLGMMVMAVGPAVSTSCVVFPGGVSGACGSRPAPLGGTVAASILLALLLLAPLVVAVYLGRKLRRARLSTA